VKWYRRDASLLARPNVRTRKKLHLSLNSGRAVCSIHIMLIDRETVDPAESLMCKRCVKMLETAMRGSRKGRATQ
jgi:hypothetical protein